MRAPGRPIGNPLCPSAPCRYRTGPPRMQRCTSQESRMGMAYSRSVARSSVLGPPESLDRGRRARRQRPKRPIRGLGRLGCRHRRGASAGTGWLLTQSTEPTDWALRRQFCRFCQFRRVARAASPTPPAGGPGHAPGAPTHSSTRPRSHERRCRTGRRFRRFGRRVELGLQSRQLIAIPRFSALNDTLGALLGRGCAAPIAGVLLRQSFNRGDRCADHPMLHSDS
jgi:hypothetical protein